MATLTEIEKGIVILRLGAHGGDCQSLRQIAKMSGLSLGRVAAAERRAIRKLAERMEKTFADAWELYRIQRIACNKRIARGVFE